MAYRNYSTSVGHIVDANGYGDFKTISAALAVAQSGSTIFIRPGTYTENPTLVSGVNLVAFTADAFTPNVTINGLCSFSGSGTITISGIRLQTNSNNLLAVTGSSASVVYLVNCFLNCSNNTGISFTSSSGSALINLRECYCNIGTTGITLFNQSSPGLLDINNCTILNSGGTSTASTISAGVLGAGDTNFSFPVTSSSTSGIALINCSFDTKAENVTCLTVGGSGPNDITNCLFASGTPPALSIGSSANTLSISVNSTNTYAIDGSGTLNYSSINFFSSNGINGTLTTNATGFLPSVSGPTQVAFKAILTSDTADSETGDGTNATIVFDTTEYNAGSGYSTSTGVFTAPQAGLYFFSATVGFNNISIVHTNGLILLSYNADTVYGYGIQMSPAAVATPGGQVVFNVVWTKNMNVNDTMYAIGAVYGGSKTVGFLGNSGSETTTFSGFLIH